MKAVTDGEFRRSWWHLDFFYGLNGVEFYVPEHGYFFHGEETRPGTVIVTGKFLVRTTLSSNILNSLRLIQVKASK